MNNIFSKADSFSKLSSSVCKQLSLILGRSFNDLQLEVVTHNEKNIFLITFFCFMLLSVLSAIVFTSWYFYQGHYSGSHPSSKLNLAINRDPKAYSSHNYHLHLQKKISFHCFRGYIHYGISKALNTFLGRESLSLFPYREQLFSIQASLLPMSASISKNMK